MKILITGICGFVGSSLAKALGGEFGTSEIFGLDNFSRKGSELNRTQMRKLGVRVIHADIRNASDIHSLPRADWVIDAAAVTSVLAGIDGRTSSRQLVENNLLGTFNLLEYCKEHQAGLALLSTSRVYSIPSLAKIQTVVVDGAFEPWPEQAFPLGISCAGVSEKYSTAPPVSLYGSTKVASEQLAIEYGITYEFPVWVNRCGVMAGAGQFGSPDQGIFAFWLHSWRENRPLRYIGFEGQGYQVRDCLHPRDLAPLLANQMKAGIDRTKPSILNISGGLQSARSIRQLSDWCSQRWGDREVANDLKPRAFDLPWVVLDHALAAEVWDWRPVTTIEETLCEIADFADLHEDWTFISA